MEIELHHIKVRDLVEGYTNDLEEGVRAYGGRLDIRPKYQREFVYKDQQRDAVITTLRRGFPLNVMYWVRIGEDSYEVLDGQQRSISICEYVYDGYAIKDLNFSSLTSDQQKQILDYELMVYICQGEESEKLAWFETINIAGAVLTKQELRNAVYTGPWLSDAKRYFSREGQSADKISKDYVAVETVRQALLELAISWINEGKIEEYMNTHKHEANAGELWLYFKRVIDWAMLLFPKKNKYLKSVPWGHLYNKYKDRHYDPKTLSVEVGRLMADDDVSNKRGIYSYVLDPSRENERYLSIRAFSDSQKAGAYERQKGICPLCGKEFTFEQMEGDHITPWSEGGKTEIDNLQMLCKPCNRHKGRR